MDLSGVESLRDTPMGDESGTRIRPSLVTILFAIVFVGIADLAWLTASGTTFPWFTTTISAQMYGTTLTAAAIGALALALVADSHVGRLVPRPHTGSEAEEEDVRLKVETNVERASDAPIVVGGIDSMIAELQALANIPTVETRDDRAVQLVVTAPRRAIEGRGRDRRLPAIRGPRARNVKRQIWMTVAGPLGMFLLFVAISGAMLPGSGGFAAANFQLNTAFVLFLSYGWPFLVAWTIIALAMLHSSGVGSRA